MERLLVNDVLVKKNVDLSIFYVSLFEIQFKNNAQFYVTLNINNEEITFIAEQIAENLKLNLNNLDDKTPVWTCSFQSYFSHEIWSEALEKFINKKLESQNQLLIIAIYRLSKYFR